MSLKALFVREMVRMTAKKRLRNATDVFALRAELDRLKEGKLPHDYGTRIDIIEMAGVPVERILPTGVSADDALSAAIIYIHGGAWVVGAPEEFRALTTRLATLTGVAVFVPDYRLAPEYPFPAALDDCEHVYRFLLNNGLPASRIVLAGDSAGGNLALALSLRLKKSASAQPAALVCLSPSTDLTASGASFKRNAMRDALLPVERLSDCIAAYCPRHNLRAPEISPLFGDLSGLPPVLLQVSNNEILLDDSVRLAERIKAAGGDVSLEIWKGLWHVWQTFPDKVPEARQAIDHIDKFVRAHLDLSAVSRGAVA